MKFQVYDAGAFNSDAIGETTVNLRRTLHKLAKEDLVSIPKSLVALTTPALPDTQRGLVLLSMDIMPKEDADGDPVGEA